jgi:hypothetical protein
MSALYHAPKIERNADLLMVAQGHPGEIMNRRQMLGFTAATLLLGMASAIAQQKRISPMDVTGTVVDGSRVTIYYSRPYTKDPQTGAPRKIWGGLVPYGKVWRTGANEATTLVTQKPLQFGNVTVPAGACTIYSIPNADGPSLLILNKQVGQWGLEYDEKQDLGRVEMKKEPLDKPVDQFTMAVEKNPAGGGVVKLIWENTQFSVPFTVKK